MQTSSIDFTPVDELLSSLVTGHSFPGAAAIVGDSTGVLHATSVGRHDYASTSPPVSVSSTLFDMASLTKVLVTTMCAMLLFQAGDLELDTPVIHLFGPEFAAADARKALITPRHLLLHEAGYPPDPTPVSYCAPAFKCPETTDVPPTKRALTFSCQSRALAHLVHSQTLARAPGEKFVYSDISMITMMDVIGHLARAKGYVQMHELLPECLFGHLAHTARRATEAVTGAATAMSNASAAAHPAGNIAPVAQCYYEAFARTRIFDKIARSPPPTRDETEAGGATPPVRDGDDTLSAASFLGFRPPARLWPAAAPTWNDTSAGFPGECIAPYRERVLQGEVSDGNAYALGGVAGHAGLFSTARHAHDLVREVLFVASGTGRLGLTPATVALFTRVHNASRSSRALGWDTAAPPHNLPLCGNLSSLTFTHTGYTGTQVCADPETRGGLLTVLLTNRVYPHADAASERRIHEARVRFNDAVLEAVRKGRDGGG